MKCKNWCLAIQKRSSTSRQEIVYFQVIYVLVKVLDECLLILKVFPFLVWYSITESASSKFVI